MVVRFPFMEQFEVCVAHIAQMGDINFHTEH
jgi:hypothetical protein